MASMTSRHARDKQRAQMLANPGLLHSNQQELSQQVRARHWKSLLHAWGVLYQHTDPNR